MDFSKFLPDEDKQAAKPDVIEIKIDKNTPVCIPSVFVAPEDIPPPPTISYRFVPIKEDKKGGCGTHSGYGVSVNTRNSGG